MKRSEKEYKRAICKNCNRFQGGNIAYECIECGADLTLDSEEKVIAVFGKWKKDKLWEQVNVGGMFTNIERFEEQKTLCIFLDTDAYENVIVRTRLRDLEETSFYPNKVYKVGTRCTLVEMPIQRIDLIPTPDSNHEE